jgi:branched-chain amino acid transport system ATP-binding protein
MCKKLTSEEEIMLSLKDVHTYYGKSHILQGVSLEVKKAEIISLLGRNGVGKTTTMRSIMGLTRARRGSISFNDEELTRVRAYTIPRKGIGLVPQGRHIFPNLTVRENLNMGLFGERAGYSYDTAFEYFPALRERINQMGGTLSGGEQQMLAIARCLVTRPHLLLLDEPSEGLMPLLVKLISEKVVEINKAGVSVLLVEQNVETSLVISHRVYIMEKGVIVHEGTPERLKAEPEVLRRFLGVGKGRRERVQNI